MAIRYPFLYYTNICSVSEANSEKDCPAPCVTAHARKRNHLLEPVVGNGGILQVARMARLLLVDQRARRTEFAGATPLTRYRKYPHPAQ